MKINPVASIVLASLLASGAVFGASAASSTATPVQKKQTEEVVHDYIIKNPEVLVQSLQGYQQKQMMEQTQKFKQIQQNSSKFASQLFHQTTDPTAGNPTGAVTLVEFFDYQCPHCIDMTKTIDETIKANPQVRVIFKEFPIRGAMSELATRAALAAQKQGKYFPLHLALMSSKTEPLTEDIIYDTAKTAGLNVDKLKVDMKDKSVDQQIKTNYQLAKDLEIMFTPVLFIAKSNVTNNAKSDAIMFVPGEVSSAQLTEVIKKIGG
jgi:protein-disulfide isomerase